MLVSVYKNSHSLHTRLPLLHCAAGSSNHNAEALRFIQSEYSSESLSQSERADYICAVVQRAVFKAAAHLEQHRD